MVATPSTSPTKVYTSSNRPVLDVEFPAGNTKNIKCTRIELRIDGQAIALTAESSTIMVIIELEQLQ